MTPRPGSDCTAAREKPLILVMLSCTCARSGSRPMQPALHHFGDHADGLQVDHHVVAHGRMPAAAAAHSAPLPPAARRRPNEVSVRPALPPWSAGPHFASMLPVCTRGGASRGTIGRRRTPKHGSTSGRLDWCANSNRSWAAASRACGWAVMPVLRSTPAAQLASARQAGSYPLGAVLQPHRPGHAAMARHPASAGAQQRARAPCRFTASAGSGPGRSWKATSASPCWPMSTRPMRPGPLPSTARRPCACVRTRRWR